MAEKEAPEIDNFGIENTIDMGTGDTELLKNLLEPETAITDPDKLKEIIKETPEDIVPKKEDEKPLKGKEIVHNP